jgi:hypothetical protein
MAISGLLRDVCPYDGRQGKSGIRHGGIGRIGMLRAPWNNVLLDELASFPLGQHDDQVDVLSYAFSKIVKPNLSVRLRM